MWLFHSSFLSYTKVFMLPTLHILLFSPFLDLSPNVLLVILLKILISFVSEYFLVLLFSELLSVVYIMKSSIADFYMWVFFLIIFKFDSPYCVMCLLLSFDTSVVFVNYCHSAGWFRGIWISKYFVLSAYFPLVYTLLPLLVLQDFLFFMQIFSYWKLWLWCWIYVTISVCNTHSPRSEV